MSTKWNDNSWQKDFLNMKSHSPSDANLLMGGVKGLNDAWRLGVTLAKHIQNNLTSNNWISINDYDLKKYVELAK